MPLTTYIFSLISIVVIGIKLYNMIDYSKQHSQNRFSNSCKLRIIILGGVFMPDVKEFLPLIIPIIIVEIVLLIYTLRHILTHDTYKRGNRLLWIIVAVAGMEFIGPILYFVLGKED